MGVSGAYSFGKGGPRFNGAPIWPAGPRVITGKAFFVHHTGSDVYRGTVDKPVATINQSVSLCTANKGDVIYVMPGHYEDLGDTSTSGAIDLDIAGISLIGLGNGPDIPRIDFNDADSDFLVGANGVHIENINFEATVTGVKLGIAIEAGVTNTTIRDCLFSVETTTTDEFLITINLLAGCNFTTIRDCHIDMGLGGAAVGIKLVGASAEVKIHDNIVKGDYSTANINGITTLSTEVLIANNLLMNGGSGGVGTEPVIEMLTGTTGYVWRNLFLCNVASIVAQSVADAMFFSENYAGEDVGAAASTTLRSAAVSVTASADD